MAKVIEVVGAILIKDGKILCAQRGGEKTLPYLWEFPGGKIEANETPQEALIRELTEELEIIVDVEQEIFEETTYEYDFATIKLTTIKCTLKSGEPVLTEHVDIKWLTPQELKTLEWAPADIPAVEKLSQLELS